MTKEDFENSVSSVLDRIQDSVATLTGNFNSMVEELTEAMDSLHGEFEQAEAALALCLEMVGDHCDNAMETLSDLREERDSAHETSHDALDAVEESVQEIAEHTEVLRATSRQEIAEFLVDAIQTISDQTVAPIEEFRTRCIETLRSAITAHVQQNLAELKGEILTSWLQGIRDAVDEIVVGLQSGLADFRSEVIEGSENSARERGVTKLAMELLNEALAPVMQELDRVISLAGSVGISIG